MKKILKNLVKNLGNYLLSKGFHDEAKSFLTTTVAFFAVDASLLLNQLYQGDISKALLHSLLIALGRSIIKALLTFIFPSLFPKRKS